MVAEKPIRIGTRGSKLALWQASAVGDALAAAHGLAAGAIEIVPITTSGDKVRDRPLSEAGGKGLFSKEIEAALIAGDIDIAVHSAKDMETLLPDGLMIGACLQRDDVRDALVTHSGMTLAKLPAGARVGTASLRREALLRRARPDLRVELLRGNVPTRIGKVDAGEIDAALLAAAGLRRLGMEGRINELLPLDSFPPACGQGTIAIECRGDDFVTRERLGAIDHRETSAALACERAFLAALDGSCKTPVAGYARIEAGALRFDGVLLSTDGREAYEASGEGEPAQAAQIGRASGEDIRNRAPAAFLKRLGIG
jgi:hydroxymethylbilane synthase